MSTEPNVEREPTPEEIQEMRSRMESYYDSQIPFLEKQVKYENLLADIELARAKRIEMTIRIAQMTMGPQEEENDESAGSDYDVDAKPQKRTLKKKE
jgi:hypothetical protein